MSSELLLRRLSLGISVVFHPTIMPLVVYGMLFFVFETLIPVSAKGKLAMLGLVGLTTFVMPAMVLVGLRQAGLVSSLHLRERRERPLPFATTTVFYTFTAWLFAERLQVVDLLHEVMLAISVALALTTLISLFYKVSAHAVGISGATGILCALYPFLEQDLLWPLLGLLIATGLVLSARLLLQAHQWHELLCGTVIGFGCCMGILRMLLD